MKLRTSVCLLSLLFTGLTLGIIAPKTVIYEGVIVGR